MLSFGTGGGSSGAGSGDVTGPGSSTDNAIARFDGAGGKTLQDSAVTIGDTGFLTSPDGADFGGEVTATALELSSPLAVAFGGTGAATLTDDGVLYGNGTGAIAATAVGTAGHVLTSNGAGNAPTFQAAAAGSGDVVGPASSTDDAIVTFDGATGKLVQNSVAVLTGAGALSGVTQLAVDNITVDGNTISSTNANGNILLDPNGTGGVQVVSGILQLEGATSSFPGFKRNLTRIEVRLADDSTYSDLTVAGGTVGVAFGGIGATNPGIRTSVGASPLFEFIKADQSAFADIAALGVRFNGTATRITQAAAGVASVDTTANGNALGALRLSQEIEANTAGSGAPNVLLASESNKSLTNEGATAENYHTLPSAAAGGTFRFHVQDTDGIRITAAAGDTIQAGTAAASAAGGFIRCATKGAFICLTAVNATEWMTEGIIGTWTVDA